MYELTIIDCFSAAHNLREYGGECERLHGHNFKVEVKIRGKSLDESGLLIDFRELKDILTKILGKIDHEYLNKIDYFKTKNPTSENIAEYIFDLLTDDLESGDLTVYEVTVRESENAAATYRNTEDR